MFAVASYFPFGQPRKLFNGGFISEIKFLKVKTFYAYLFRWESQTCCWSFFGFPTVATFQIWESEWPDRWRKKVVFFFWIDEIEFKAEDYWIFSFLQTFAKKEKVLFVDLCLLLLLFMRTLLAFTISLLAWGRKRLEVDARCCPTTRYYTMAKWFYSCLIIISEGEKVHGRCTKNPQFFCSFRFS